MANDIPAGSGKSTDQGARGSRAGGDGRVGTPNRQRRDFGAGADGGFAVMDQFTRAFGDMGLADMFDLAGLSAAYQRNMEAVSAATRASVQGAERVARCEIEMAQQMMTDLSEAMRLLMSSETPLARAAHCAELSRRSCERAVARMREVNDLIHNSQREAFELLNQCAMVTMAEVQDTFEKKEKKERQIEHA